MNTASATSVMVIDDDPQVCRLLGSILENEGANVVLQHSAQQGLSALKSRPVDVLFTDLRLGDGDGLSVISEARKLCPNLSVIIITGYGSVESSVGAFRLGVVDYLTKPFRAEQVAQAPGASLPANGVARAAALPGPSAVNAARARRAGHHCAKPGDARGIGACQTRGAGRRSGPRHRRTRGGQGVDRARHFQSKPAVSTGPFVKINCGAIQDEQLEAIMFGEDAQAGPATPVSGRWSRRPAVFCSCTTWPSCPSGCRPNSFRRFRAGPSVAWVGNQPIPLTARIAASTAEDLSTLAAAGKFFHELYYYLHVVPVHVPALRDRREDIRPLADQFLQESLRLRPPGKSGQRLAFAKDAHRALESYSWPGNVYELSNLVRRAVVFGSGGEITAAEMAELFPPPPAHGGVETITIPYAGDLRVIERSIVSEVINRNNGNKSAAAPGFGLPSQDALSHPRPGARHRGPYGLRRSLSSARPAPRSLNRDRNAECRHDCHAATLARCINSAILSFMNDDNSSPPQRQADWIERTGRLLDSYRHWLGHELIDRAGDAAAQSERLFEAPFVVVAHGEQADPIFNYANRLALQLWEMDLATLLVTPSRLTAEPVHRQERERLLERTARQGFVDDYQGIRISSTGRRFRIQRAIVWNVLDITGREDWSGGHVQRLARSIIELAARPVRRGFGRANGVSALPDRYDRSPTAAAGTRAIGQTPADACQSRRRLPLMKLAGTSRPLLF